MSKALEGIRVLEFTHVVAGPFAGMLLGDMGAEVIKVEKPVTGEFYRIYGPRINGIPMAYPTYNRNKKDLTLNVQDPKAKEVLYDLIKNVDVVIENYKPGLLKKMGMGYEALKQYNPKLIMASISGYGQTGPDANKKAYDMTITAISGIMSITGEPGQPTRPGSSIIDYLSGMYADLAILAALHHRDLTGEGQYIDVSMLQAAISILDAKIQVSRLMGQKVRGRGNRMPSSCPVNTFPTKNGFVQISCTTNQNFFDLAKAMNREDLLSIPEYQKDTGRKAREEEVEAIVREWTESITTEEAVEALEKHAVPCAPICMIEDLDKNEQLKARNAIRSFDYPGIGEYPYAAFVPQFSTLEVSEERAPLLGEHTDEILSRLAGYTPEQIQKLKDDQVI